MNNCPCPEEPVPSVPCCPDTIDLASSIVVKDRDCKDRRLKINDAGVLAARHGKGGMMDGSAEKPLTMDFETFFAANGYVLLQDPGGRVIAVKPNEDLFATDAVLQLVFQDGAVKFVPITYSNLFSDADAPSNSKGILAMVACGGPEGSIRLGKFMPFTTTPTGGPWFVLVDKDNQAYVSKKAIDEIPATDSVEKLDLILGSVGGKWKTIAPVKDKTLIGIEDAGALKWALKDGTGNLVPVARTNILSRHNDLYDWPTGGTESVSINIATLVGYLAEYKYAYLHFRYLLNTQNYSIINNVSVEGRAYISAYSTGAPDHGSDSSHNTALVEIPTSKTWNVTIVTEQESGHPSGLRQGRHTLDIFIDGWMK